MEGRSAGRTLLGGEMDGVPCRQCWQPSPPAVHRGRAEYNPNPVSVAHILFPYLSFSCNKKCGSFRQAPWHPCNKRPWDTSKVQVGNTVDTGNISFRKYYGRGLLRPETETVNGKGERCQPYFMSVTLGLDLRGKNNFPQKRKSPKRNHA